jgi:hypothetical protein
LGLLVALGLKIHGSGRPRCGTTAARGGEGAGK